MFGACARQNGDDPTPGEHLLEGQAPDGVRGRASAGALCFTRDIDIERGDIDI